jgi:T-complex protein 1 subunit eta
MWEQQPQIILLKEGTDTTQGKPQLISNINACIAVVDAVRTTLGPRGMDKLIHGDKGTTISNDGATIMKLLDIVHPAAKILVDIAKSQDSEVHQWSFERLFSCLLPSMTTSPIWRRSDG